MNYSEAAIKCCASAGRGLESQRAGLVRQLARCLGCVVTITNKEKHFMGLEIRPNCEHCNKDLPPESTEAMICSFECTFCKPCLDEFIGNVCPNCGGNLVSRPIRPRQNLKDDNHLGTYPGESSRRHRPKNTGDHRKFRAVVEKILPEHR